MPPLSFADEGPYRKDYAQFLVNWIVHARMSKIENSAAIVVGAMDETVLRVARKWNVRTFSMEHTIHSFGWGAQIGAVNELITDWKFSTLMCDVDMVWLKDPFPWFDEVPARRRADLLMSSDCASCMEDEAEGKCIMAPFNIGRGGSRRRRRPRKKKQKHKINSLRRRNPRLLIQKAPVLTLLRYSLSIKVILC